MRRDKCLPVRRQKFFGRGLVVDPLQHGGIVDLRVIADLFKLHAVDDGQPHERGHGDDRPEKDVGRAPPHSALRAVRDRSEKGKHEQSKDIVERHDDARYRLRHAELVGQDQGNDIVVGLPERADQKKRESDADSPLIVQFHLSAPPVKRFFSTGTPVLETVFIILQRFDLDNSH